MKTSIIIPYWNQVKMTEACLEAIRENTEDYEVILVDNGSSEDITLHIATNKIIRNVKNEGFPVAVNQGVAVAEGEYLCILNNDVLVSPRWLEHLIDHLKEVDVVGPITNLISGPQMRRVSYYEDYEEMKIIASGVYEKHKGVLMRLYRLVGFCMVMRREVWEKVGPLDPIYSPGNYEDDDWCLRAIEAGFKLGFAHDVYVHHYGSVTHQALRLDHQALLFRNQEIFNSRWSKDRIIAAMNANGG